MATRIVTITRVERIQIDTDDEHIGEEDFAAAERAAFDWSEASNAGEVESVVITDPDGTILQRN